MAVVLSAGTVRALDPNRTLTQYLQRIWQVQQGLPQATIFSIQQSKDGYIWLGSPGGLIRFDGIRFITVPGPLLENLWVKQFCEDRDGAFWIATDGAGLVCLRDGRAEQFGRSQGLPSDDVRCVLIDRHGQLWAGTADGLVAWGARPTVYRQANGLADNSVRAICEDADGKLWIGGEGNRLTTWDGTQFTRHAVAGLPAHGSVMALHGAEDGAVWVGTTEGLARLSAGETRLFTAADGLASNSVLCLAGGHAGTLWVGTKEGFSRVLPTAAAEQGPAAAAPHFEIESFRPRDGLSQSTVYALFEDREGSLWVGTKHGLNQFIDRRTMLYTVHENLPSNDAGPVVEDAGGNLWAGTLGAGLGRFDGRRFAPFTKDDGLPSNTIYTLADGGNQRLWVGTDQGLAQMTVLPRPGGPPTHKLVERTYTTADGLPSNIVWCLSRDHEGTVWAGTEGGIARLQGDRFVAPPGPSAGPAKPVRAMICRRDGSIVAATADGGLYRYRPGGLEAVRASALEHKEIAAFYEDADGLLWIGTVGNGLVLLDGDKLSNFTTKDGLFDDEIFAIVPDAQDRLWMASSKGIYYVPQADLVKLARHKIQRVTYTSFSPMDSLRTIECQGGVEPAACRTRDGRIWFSTTRGVIVVNPNHLRRDLPPVPVRIEEVVVNGKVEQPYEVKKLPPGETNLTFRYAALSFISPTRTAFHYQLEGYDREWSDWTSRREAFYTNLPPGNYRFRVTARSMDGVESEVANPVVFTLEPHFYQTGWFWLLCSAAIAFVIWAAYRLRVSQIRVQLQAVVSERSRIARELHDTLMQGFSGVTMEMQALSVRLPASSERDTLEEIIHDAGVCLQEARRSVAGLRSPTDGHAGLAGAIAEAARHLTETQDVRLKLRLEDVPLSLPADVQYNLLRILQEAVTNAVKHSAAGTIDVSLDCDRQMLTLTVKDDGVGFAEATGGAQPGHYGLIGMRERAAQIGGTLHVDSEPGHGTTATLTLTLSPTGQYVPPSKSPQSV